MGPAEVAEHLCYGPRVEVACSERRGGEVACSELRGGLACSGRLKLVEHSESVAKAGGPAEPPLGVELHPEDDLLPFGV